MRRIRSLPAAKEKPLAHGSDPAAPLVGGTTWAARGPPLRPPLAERSGAQPGAAAGAGRRARAELRRRQINPRRGRIRQQQARWRETGQFPPQSPFSASPPPASLQTHQQGEGKKKKEKRQKVKRPTSRPVPRSWGCPTPDGGPRRSFPGTPPEPSTCPLAGLPPWPPAAPPRPAHLQSRIPGTCPSAGR